eukprot:scpid102024/ scgid1468/ 
MEQGFHPDWHSPNVITESCKATGINVDEKLAKQLVMAAGEFVNNFESIMTTYIKENRHGLADTDNVAGQLFYIVHKKEISCKELLCIFGSVHSGGSRRESSTDY